MRNGKDHHTERVLTTVHSPSAAALSAVAASWCRSAIKHGLDPDAGHRAERVSAAQLALLREANEELLVAAAPTLDNLFSSVGQTGCCLVLTDSDGVVLEARAQQSDQSHFNRIGLASGACWSEAVEGTNGIGTCLAEARPIAILTQDHFASRNIGVSCIDAPVFDPDGQLVAALDVSSCRRDMGEATAALIAALVQDAARQIERDFFCSRFADTRIVYAPDQSGKGAALLAVDSDDLVVGATRAARQRYGLTGLNPKQPKPLSDVLGLSSRPDPEASTRLMLRQALARAQGNVTLAARSLGIGRATFYRRMERAGMLSQI
ncbi:MAG: hypothetical protein RL186_1371 [Pseudomonadota bacterium]